MSKLFNPIPEEKIDLTIEMSSDELMLYGGFDTQHRKGCLGYVRRSESTPEIWYYIVGFLRVAVIIREPPKKVVN